MASENVQVAERAFAALSEGGIDAMLPFVHEDFEMTTPPDLASEPDVYEGHAGVRRWWDSFYEAMDEVHLHADRIEDLGGELVVSFRISARGRSTGLEVVQEAAGLCTVEDGKAKRIRFFATRDDALDAAGQTESHEEGLRRAIEAFNRRDLDAALESFHPDIEWLPADQALHGAVYEGHAGVRAFWDTWFETMDDFRIEITDCIETGNDVVLLETRAVGTGRGSGAEVDAELFHVYDYRDGKAYRARLFGDRSDALQAAGLPE